MDVINLSIGEPEVEPSRDLVARALDAAAAAGVVPVVAAGNDFDDFGRGSLASPGTSRPRDHGRRGHEPDAAGRSSSPSFSSAGPTPLSLRLKPDMSAPGRLDPLVRARAAGRRCRARPWRRRRSPARRRSSASGTRTGRWRSSRRR